MYLTHNSPEFNQGNKAKVNGINLQKLEINY